MAMEINGKRYGWTQPICRDDWYAHYGNGTRQPTTLKPEFREETCCYCGKPTRSGIFVRENPREVPYPTEEND